MKEAETILRSIDEDNSIAGILARHDPDKLQQISDVMQKESLAKLEQVLLNSIIGKKRAQFWLVNKEYSRRGIPPVFRKLPATDNDESGVPHYDLFLIDLEWLWFHHRGHQPFIQKWKSIFQSPAFYHPTAKFIYETATNQPMWKTVRGLALQDEWQVELWVIKTEKHFARLRRIEDDCKRVEVNLRAKLHARGRRSSEEIDQIIQRRMNVWKCAILGSCSPQRTAQLYKAKTGIEMSRQLAAKTIAAIEQDEPTAFKYIRRASK